MFNKRDSVGGEESSSLKHKNNSSHTKETTNDKFDSLKAIFHNKFSDQYYEIKTVILKIAKKVLKRFNNVKSYFVSQIFWGRGSLYRYIAIIAIFIPVTASIIFLYRKSVNSPTQETPVISELFIQNTANTNTANSNSVDGKIVEKDAISQNTDGSTSWYEIKDGDTLATIAEKFKVSVNVILWANSLPDGATITPRQKLRIIPTDGLVYTAKSGDKINDIVKKYNVSLTDLRDLNGLADNVQDLPTGKKVLLPGAADISNPPVTNQNYNYIEATALKPTYRCPSDDTWCFMQTDTAWADIILGGRGARNAYAYSNIRNSGCLATDIAMLAAYYYPEKHITPATIAYDSNLFVGANIRQDSGIIHSLFTFRPLGGFFGGVKWKEVNDAIDAKHPVIVHIGSIHWIVLYQRLPGGGYLANDPAYGGAIKFYNTGSITAAYLYLKR